MSLPVYETLADRDPLWESHRILGGMALWDMTTERPAAKEILHDYVEQRQQAIASGDATLSLDHSGQICGYELKGDNRQHADCDRSVQLRSIPEEHPRNDRKLDSYAIFGLITKLLASSRYHRQFGVGFYLGLEIIEPVKRRQFRLYSQHGRPTAFVSWAWINDAVRDSIVADCRSFFDDEWTSGEILFFNDWISPNNAREVKKDLEEKVFPSPGQATSVRRYHDGSIRRVNRWQW